MGSRPEPIDLSGDPRVEHRAALLNGQQYHYLYAVPKGGSWKTTVFLIHGWPDLSAGWRYQIPALLELGCRVVAPDMMGYGGTDAPRVPQNPLNLYSFKRASDDIAELARQLGASKIVLGGHDWGGMVVWRCALWHPELITNVFVVCTPYAPPSEKYVSIIDIVKGPIPEFGYQLHLAGTEVEGNITTKEQIRQFLNGMYGGRNVEGKRALTPEYGVNFDSLEGMGKSPLFNDKEMDYYVDYYSRNGLHGTVNWYRTRETNWKDELELVKAGRFNVEVPCLFIQAAKDIVLKPALAAGMDRFVPTLVVKQVDAAHWALWEKPAEVNQFVKSWFEEVVFAPKSNL
jgi:pimeloyl-ACP methyl ester carboxylesterase